jgi:predicted phosphodiesterase
VKRAIISDIHSNFEALTAVLADVRAQGITDVICLGDIVGYGPNPRECIDLVM